MYRGEKLCDGDTEIAPSSMAAWQGKKRQPERVRFISWKELVNWKQQFVKMKRLTVKRNSSLMQMFSAKELANLKPQLAKKKLALSRQVKLMQTFSPMELINFRPQLAVNRKVNMMRTSSAKKLINLKWQLAKKQVNMMRTFLAMNDTVSLMGTSSAKKLINPKTQLVTPETMQVPSMKKKVKWKQEILIAFRHSRQRLFRSQASVLRSPKTNKTLHRLLQSPRLSGAPGRCGAE
jgi:hypothetical protein